MDFHMPMHFDGCCCLQMAGKMMQDVGKQIARLGCLMFWTEGFKNAKWQGSLFGSQQNEKSMPMYFDGSLLVLQCLDRFLRCTAGMSLESESHHLKIKCCWFLLQGRVLLCFWQKNQRPIASKDHVEKWVKVVCGFWALTVFFKSVNSKVNERWVEYGWSCVARQGLTMFANEGC